MSDTQYFHLRARAGCDGCVREIGCVRIAKRKDNGKDPYLAEWVGGDQVITDSIRDGFGCPDMERKIEDTTDDD